MYERQVMGMHLAGWKTAAARPFMDTGTDLRV
jgi:hypothetical protein